MFCQAVGLSKGLLRNSSGRRGYYSVRSCVTSSSATGGGFSIPPDFDQATRRSLHGISPHEEEKHHHAILRWNGKLSEKAFPQCRDTLGLLTERGKGSSKFQSSRSFSTKIPPTSNHRNENLHPSNTDGHVPTLEEASEMPLHYRNLDNSTLVTIAATGNHRALREMMTRHVMTVEQCNYEDAQPIVHAIDHKNTESMQLLAMPLRVSAAAALCAGIAALPLVYHLPTVEWFNEAFVTTDHPPPSDLDTPLEVSIWSWSWMEPSMGTFTYFILCMQLVRSHMHELGWMPITERIKLHRAKALCKAFPHYDTSLLTAYSRSTKIYDADAIDRVSSTKRVDNP